MLSANEERELGFIQKNGAILLGEIAEEQAEHAIDEIVRMIPQRN
jgi:hypothetical protein